MNIFNFILNFVEYKQNKICDFVQRYLSFLVNLCKLYGVN